jgi:hypothetical protein
MRMMHRSLTARALSLAIVLIGCNGGGSIPARESPSSGGRVANESPVVPAADASRTNVSDPLPDGAECARDEDCAPTACCHAVACAPVAQRPACEGVMCSMDCRPGTIDCGGGCLCQAGRCGARLAPGPVPTDAGRDDASIATIDPDAATGRDAGRRRRR